MKRRSTLPDIPAEFRETARLKSQASLISRMRSYGIRSGSELARLAGLKPGAVNHLVFGRRTSCSANTAQGIEEALGLAPGDLFVRTEYQVPGYPASTPRRTDKEAA